MDQGGVEWELYGVAPNEFAAARAAEVKRARSAGDRARAKQIQSLRKPTLAAWLVNQLMREQADAMGLLLDLGDEMRAGMSGLSAEELRELTKRRYQLIAALIEQARPLAVAAGLRMSDAVATEVRSTLESTLADPDSAEEVRAGCLVGALHVSSFGFDSARSQRPVRQEPADDNTADVADLSERRERRQREIEQAQAGVDAAEATAAKAAKSVKKAAKRLTTAEQLHDEATAEVERLEEQLRAATATVEERAAVVQKRREAKEAADSDYEEASEELEDAQRDLRQLER